MTEAADSHGNLYPNVKGLHRGAAVRKHRLIGYTFVCPVQHLDFAKSGSFNVNVSACAFFGDASKSRNGEIESISLRRWLTG